MNRRNLNPGQSRVGLREPLDPLSIPLANYLFSLQDLSKHAGEDVPAWLRKAIATLHEGIEAHVIQLSAAPAIKDSGTHVSTTGSPWNYDMDSCPVGAKVWLLNLSGCATTGPLSENMRKYFAAWAPLPKRDKAEEKRRGLNL
jgi:hypothetical protein